MGCFVQYYKDKKLTKQRNINSGFEHEEAS